MDLGSLLGGLSGEEGQGQQGASQGDAMGDMLGALMGGQDAQGGGGDLGGLLGGMLGGQGGQGGDAMMGMLGGLLGGMGGASTNAGAMGGMNTGMNAALAPLADMLSEKLGIPREMAMSAMAIIVPMILSKLAGGGQARSGDPLSGADRSQGLTFSRDEQDQMIQSLTSQTGMSEEQAVQVLNQTVQVLGSQ